MWLEWERAGFTSRLPLDRPLTIGRDAAADVRLPDPTVSRRHAVVSIVAGQPLVDATGSTNGIQFDRGRADRVSLSFGQSFRIGDATFRVVGGSGPVAAPVTGPGPVAYPIAGAAFGSPYAVRGESPAGRARPSAAMVAGLGAILVVALLAVGAFGYLALSGSAPAHTSQAPGQTSALGLGAASLDPDAPAFPVPAGSTLVNAQMEGSGAAAYRIVAWQSGKDYATTAAFYTGLSDSRWRVNGTPGTTPQSTDVTLADSSDVFAGAEVEVSRTDPVEIDVRFVSKDGPPAQSFAPGPTMELQPLPAATALPDGFPPEMVPSGTSLEDAGAIGSTYFALFGGSVDAGAYEKQIGSLVTITNTHAESGATVIDFTLKGNPGQVVIDPTNKEISVEVTV
jgi:hypothetical protein